MEILAIILLITGLIFCIIELIVPGFGIFGILGLILILISWALTIIFIPFGLLIVLIEVILGCYIFYLIINYIKRKQIFGKIVLYDIIKNKKEIANLDEFVGREGITTTALRPFGNAQFNSIILEVVSENGYINNNTKIKCTRVIENKLYVKQINSN